MVKKVLLFLCIVLYCLSHTEACGRGAISISNNGYGSILISIAERVEHNDQLIERIKSAFTEASAFLYQATRFRAYFQNITILVPKSWPDDPSYQPLADEAADKSDIVVDLPDEGHGDRPFTIKTTPCGEPGYYMHLTPNFLLDEQIAAQFGTYGRVLVHEWGHLRYGVYDEYPAENGGQHFYADEQGFIEPTRCSIALWGEIKTTDGKECNTVNGLPEVNCRFYDDTGLSGSYASLMYRTNLDHLAFFCDNDTTDELTYHNYKAPNMQNIMCGERSVWEILREHPDFKNDNNPPTDTGTVPNFRIVRQAEKKTVLVLDVSGSMQGNRLAKLNQGCSTYLSTIVRNGEEVGIVHFSNVAIIQKSLTTVSNTTRQELLDALPAGVGGATSIGSGILKGLEIFETNEVYEGGTLIIVSDGEENTDPRISDVWDRVMASGVTVHSIAITDDTDSNLDALAQATGGLSFLYSESDTSNAINEAFRAIGELSNDPSERSYPLFSMAAAIPGNDLYQNEALIDQTLGRDTEFNFDYSNNIGLDIQLRSPTGTVYDVNSPECSQDTKYNVYRFYFASLKETGVWAFNVTNLATSSQNVAITVSSKPSTPGEYPIIAQAFWGKRDLDLIVPGDPDKQALYASVSKGYIPVIYANVTATVEQPGSSTSIEVTLRDNGAGADLVANDGIYSAYYVSFTSSGRYAVTVSVNSNPATVISPIRIIGQGVPRGTRSLTTLQADRPTGDFQRFSSGGSFELKNYVPGTKVYPPGKIQDFQVTQIQREMSEVQLAWTAVGAQLDNGILTEYDMRYSLNFDSLRDNFDQQNEVSHNMLISGNLSLPSAAGTRETVIVKLPTTDEITYYFAIKGVDLEGRNSQGPVSNIVSATMRKDFFPGNNNDDDLALILGLVFGFLAFFAIIATIAFVTLNRRKSQSKNLNKPVKTIQPQGSINTSYTKEDIYENV